MIFFADAEIKITATDSDAKDAVDALTREIKNKFDEDYWRKVYLAGKLTRDDDGGGWYEHFEMIKKNSAIAETSIISKIYGTLFMASQIVRFANQFCSKITFTAKNKTVDAKSILMIFSMGLLKDTEIKITATGPDAEYAVNSLKREFEIKFDEDYWHKIYLAGKLNEDNSGGWYQHFQDLECNGFLSRLN